MAHENVKVGDPWFRVNYSLDVLVEVTVIKVTKTQIVFSDNERMVKETGNIVGECHWNRVSYLPYDNEIVEQFKTRAEYQQLKNALLRSLRDLEVQVKANNIKVDQIRTILTSLKGVES